MGKNSQEVDKARILVQDNHKTEMRNNTAAVRQALTEVRCPMKSYLL